jgi:hypothetical protein
MLEGDRFLTAFAHFQRALRSSAQDRAREPTRAFGEQACV